jgi:hypothetical protein
VAPSSAHNGKEIMNESLRPDDTRDALRNIGALLFGIGVLMLLFRKWAIADEYADGIVLIIFAIPAVLLYGGSVATQDATGGTRPWQGVWSVFGLIFVALTLFQLVATIDDTPDTSLNLFWIFAVVAGLGFYAGVARGVRFQLLAGSIALIVSWSELWNKILSDGIDAHFGVYRGLLGLLSIGLLAGALYIWRTNPGGDERAASATGVSGEPALWKASELFTGAGISAVIACSLGITSLFGLNPLVEPPVQPIDTNALWDILLLLVSLGLVGLGAQIGVRGPVYVGAIGLFLFLLIVGYDLDSDSPDPTNLGLWPVVLIVLGAVGIGVSLVREASLGDAPRRFIENLRRG